MASLGRAAGRRLLPEGRLAGPMPWVIAIVTFLAVLIAAGGLALGGAARTLGQDLEGRVTVQIVDADPQRREAQAGAVVRLLGGRGEIAEVERLDDAELARLLAPWIGLDALAADEAPVPAMIDLRLRPGASVEALTREIRAVAPAARLDAHAGWLAPLTGLIDWLRWLAAGLVALMAVATAAVVILAARAALDTHRATIDVLHLMGATDVQVARLFQRRLALDALFGAGLGFLLGAVVLALLGTRLAALETASPAALALGTAGWVTLAALPVAAVLLAALAARLAVVRTLRTML